MQGCSFYSHGSILGMYLIEWQFYQNNIDTTTLNFFQCRIEIFLLKKQCVRCKYRNNSVICIREIQQQNSLEGLSAT